ncbi:MAG: glycosyl transferase family 2, partial [Chloroflexi bacterium]|nr:glycosyl transferase family 2 [Chloroflexota bacterium]
MFLADDHSEDGTGVVARRIAEEMGTDRLTVLGVGPLPEGWTGKLWAVQQ